MPPLRQPCRGQLELETARARAAVPLYPGTCYSPSGAVTRRWRDAGREADPSEPSSAVTLPAALAALAAARAPAAPLQPPPPFIDAQLDPHLGVRFVAEGGRLELYLAVEGLRLRCAGRWAGPRRNSCQPKARLPKTGRTLSCAGALPRLPRVLSLIAPPRALPATPDALRLHCGNVQPDPAGLTWAPPPGRHGDVAGSAAASPLASGLASLSWRGEGAKGAGGEGGGSEPPTPSRTSHGKPGGETGVDEPLPPPAFLRNLARQGGAGTHRPLVAGAGGGGGKGAGAEAAEGEAGGGLAALTAQLAALNEGLQARHRPGPRGCSCAPRAVTAGSASGSSPRHVCMCWCQRAIGCVHSRVHVVAFCLCAGAAGALDSSSGERGRGRCGR